MTYISKIERGTSRLELVELFDLAGALGQDPMEIVARFKESLQGYTDFHRTVPYFLKSLWLRFSKQQSEIEPGFKGNWQLKAWKGSYPLGHPFKSGRRYHPQIRSLAKIGPRDR